MTLSETGVAGEAKGVGRIPPDAPRGRTTEGDGPTLCRDHRDVPVSLNVFRSGWRGDWRLDDERADREAELYYANSRATEDFA